MENGIAVTQGPHFELTEGQQAVRDLARDFAEKEMRPLVMKYDESQDFPFEIVEKLAGLGFMGMTWPEELGGAALDDISAAIVIEELARVDPSVALTVASHNSLCTGHIMLFGNEEQKRRYIPDLASGKALGAWGLTEPGSGSDSGGMKTTADTGRNRLGHQWKQDLYHAGFGRVNVRDHGGNRQEQGEGRHLRLHPGKGDEGILRRQEGEQARHALQRHGDASLRQCACARRRI